MSIPREIELPIGASATAMFVPTSVGAKDRFWRINSGSSLALPHLVGIGHQVRNVKSVGPIDNTVVSVILTKVNADGVTMQRVVNVSDQCPRDAVFTNADLISMLATSVYEEAAGEAGLWLKHTSDLLLGGN